MNTPIILDMLKQLEVTSIEFDQYKWCRGLFDDICNEDVPVEQHVYLTWLSEDGFEYFNNAKDYKDFKNTDEGCYYSDVSTIDCYIDSETDCVVFMLYYWYECDLIETICGFVPIKMLEDSGIKMVYEEEQS